MYLKAMYIYDEKKEGHVTDLVYFYIFSVNRVNMLDSKECVWGSEVVM